MMKLFVLLLLLSALMGGVSAQRREEGGDDRDNNEEEKNVTSISHLYAPADDTKMDMGQRDKCKSLTIVACLAQLQNTKMFHSALAESEKDGEVKQWAGDFFTILGSGGGGAGGAGGAGGSNATNTTGGAGGAANTTGGASGGQGGKATFFVPSDKAYSRGIKYMKTKLSMSFTPRLWSALLNYHLVPTQALKIQEWIQSAEEESGKVLKTNLKDAWYVNLGQSSGQRQAAPNATQPGGGQPNATQPGGQPNATQPAAGGAQPGGTQGGAGAMSSPQIIQVLKKNGSAYVNYGLSDSGLFTSSILLPDIECQNGVIHVVDKLMMFPWNPSLLLALNGYASTLAAFSSGQPGFAGLLESYPGLTLLVPPPNVWDQKLHAGSQSLTGGAGGAGGASSGRNSSMSQQSGGGNTQQIDQFLKAHIVTQPVYLFEHSQQGGGAQGGNASSGAGGGNMTAGGAGGAGGGGASKELTTLGGKKLNIRTERGGAGGGAGGAAGGGNATAGGGSGFAGRSKNAITYYVGNARVQNWAITRNGAILYLDSALDQQ